MEFILHILILVFIYSIVALSLNLVVGYLGILSIAHGALFGIAAYTLGILTLDYNMSFWAALMIGGIVSSFFGLIIVIPCLKLKGDYLALATFGFAVAAYDIFNNWIDLTKGPMGIPGISAPTVFGFELSNKGLYFIVVIIILSLALLSIRRIATSPWGRVLQAIREEEVAVEVIGRNPRRYKLITFIFSAFWSGIAGGLYAGYTSFIHPSNFTPMVSILILCMVILGGIGSLSGSIAGVFVLISLPEILRFLNLPGNLVGSLNQILYGLILVLFMLLRPQGLFGKYKFIGE